MTDYKYAIAQPIGAETVYVDMTADEIAARQVEENTPLPLPIPDQLNAVFNQLPLETQADFSPLKAAVKLELDQNRLDIASLIIQRATISEDLETVRQQLLDILASATESNP
jgi:hypothetical protein